MKSLAYYKSERFIWDGLIEDAKKGLSSLYEYWKKGKKIEEFLVCWPSEHLKTKDGTVVSGPVTFVFDTKESAQRQRDILKTVELSRAYALLLVEQYPERIRVLLESKHGTKCWTIPIQQSGDVKTLGPCRDTTDTECVGLLWRPKAGEA